MVILVAATPLLFLSGLTREFSRPLVFAYALALLASLLVSLTVTPALSFLLLQSAPLERRQSPIVRWLQRGYSAALARLVGQPRGAYAAVALAMVAGLVLAVLADVLPQRGGLPALQHCNVLIHWDGVPGTSEPEMSRITARVSDELRAIPGVSTVGAHFGRAVNADHAVNINAGELWVTIAPDANYDQTLAAIHQVVDGYPGIYRDVLIYLEERLRQLETGSARDLVVRVYGEDPQILQNEATRVRELMAGVDGVVEHEVAHQEEVPQLQVQVDLAAAQRYGIKPGDVRRAAATLLAGEEVGDIFWQGKAYDVVVWGKPEFRHSVTGVENLLLDTPSGAQVRLADVADIRVAPAPNVIQHDGIKRYIDVTANVRGRDLGSVAEEIEQNIQNRSFPLEYRAEVLGEYAARQSAQRTLLAFSIGAAVIAFLLLQAAVGSWRLTSALFLILPSALVGGMLATFAGDGSISLGPLLGLLAVFRIVARNSILLLSHYQHLEQVEGQPFGVGLVLPGARERLGLSLMTTLATMLALAALVVAGNIPGNEIIQPMALVVVGGLITATLLNLFVVPSLYLRFGRGRRRRSEPDPAGTAAGD